MRRQTAWRNRKERQGEEEEEKEIVGSRESFWSSSWSLVEISDNTVSRVEGGAAGGGFVGSCVFLFFKE
jgi:hypothetical protein